MSSTSARYKKSVFYIIFVLIGVVFISRLFYLQILDPSYRIYANNNVLHEMVIYPSRGLVYDRNKELLVYNDAIYDLMVLPKDINNMDTIGFCKLLGISLEGFHQRMAKANGYSKNLSSIFEKNLSPTAIAKFQEKLFSYPGFYVQVRTDRRYKTNNAAHVLGYIGEINDNQLVKGGYYKPGDFIGISGIEKSYEERLRGVKGVRYILVDVLNREQGSYKDGMFDSLPVSGENVVTTLDFTIQAYAEELLKNKIGSLVAIEPATGEILALVSEPGYDPNLFVGRERGNNYMMLLKDPKKPLFNRALSAPYTPGSIFKVLDALIGLDQGVITPDSRFPCGGGYRLGSHTVRCTHVHSALNLRESIQHSCNPYYCAVFRNIIDMNRYPKTSDGYQNWYEHIKSFGIGRRLDIDLAHEYPGILKSPSYFDKVYGAGRWKSTNVISLAIGQGEVGITPLQMANVAACIANKGWFMTPHIIRGIGDSMSVPEQYRKKNYSLVDSQFFGPVHDGMQMAVEHGTAFWSRIPDIVMCGKTGTAQNPHGEDHSVFIAFAPRDTPKIAVACVVENAGFGSTYAAPISSLIVEKYLKGKDFETKRTYLEYHLFRSDLINNRKLEDREVLDYMKSRKSGKKDETSDKKKTDVKDSTAKEKLDRERLEKEKKDKLEKEKKDKEKKDAAKPKLNAESKPAAPSKKPANSKAGNTNAPMEILPEQVAGLPRQRINILII